ncbi:Crp/Fnr family transcriptional regulator [Salipiger thiooxidans]|uniref:Crp/Fnr family transcriptional regulator n=1 Tax=Salipiger thiooxidans TaxID=282683 RepID=UPI001CD750E1|nr:Crp/Fnr family transcriptional regulator [Salipiger thiooxidans]MCA0846987.1 Crp/Fnr family transcriptional regulator [Salipiger thiooxidans]
MKISAAYPELLEIDLLEGLPVAARAAFLDACTLRFCNSETPLLTQHEPTTGCYLIARGRVVITYLDGDGNESMVHVAGPGEIVGEVEALSGSLCVASCTTMPDTTVLNCPVSVLMEYAQQPSVLRNLARIFHERLIRDLENRSVEQFQTVEARLNNYLCVFSTADDPEIRVSQTQLATLLACSRQKVNRMLKDLRDAGVVDLSRGRIRVLDRSAVGCRRCAEEALLAPQKDRRNG